MPIRSRLLLAVVPAVLVGVLGTVAPAQAAPANRAVSYHAEGQVVLPDGRAAGVVVDEYPGGEGSGPFTEVQVSVACASPRDCSTGGDSVLDLDGHQLGLTPGLSRATLPPVAMTLHGWTGRNASQQVDTPITVSAAFTASGPLTTTVVRGGSCAASTPRACSAVGIAGTRPADVVLTINGTTATGSGSLSSGRDLPSAAPR